MRKILLHGGIPLLFEDFGLFLLDYRRLRIMFDVALLVSLSEVVLSGFPANAPLHGVHRVDVGDSCSFLVAFGLSYLTVTLTLITEFRFRLDGLAGFGMSVRWVSPLSSVQLELLQVDLDLLS